VPAWLNGAVLGENFLGVMNGPTDFDFWQRNISRVCMKAQHCAA